MPNYDDGGIQLGFISCIYNPHYHYLCGYQDVDYVASGGINTIVKYCLRSVCE